jgi:hypothetical protein
MKARFLKWTLVIAIITSTIFLTGCAGMHMGGGIGLNFSSGPYGPTLTPSLNMGFYGGGGYW